MILLISHNFFHYEAGNLCRLFFPYEKLQVQVGKAIQGQDALLVTVLVSENICTATIAANGHTAVQRADVNGNEEYPITKAMFLALREFTGYAPRWGMLTGIHPVKLYVSLVRALGAAGADRVFCDKYFVSEEKLNLCRRIEKAQASALRAYDENDFSLYISIPFCPSRCSYCSFVSQSVEKSQNMIAPYLELLLREVQETAKIVSDMGLHLVSAYIGGGTPTTLSAEQLARLISTVRENFDMRMCTEFTVEAGRPDTINREKLEAFRDSDITRISINPQSLEDEVLALIGRKHSAADVVSSYELAREIGMNNINMDLIAGLQGDTTKTFMSTLDKVIALNPENVTVHSLALKRSAKIFRDAEKESYHSNRTEVEKMIDYSVVRLTEEGYEPYYLYRQSRMAGNLENTGWAKKGTECAYNIYTMDESQTVIACGAGGVSKLRDPYSDRLERIFNFKYAYEYIARFDEILDRKKEMPKLYEQFRQRIHQVHQPSGTD